MSTNTENIQKPASVKLGILILWISLVIAIIKAFFSLPTIIKLAETLPDKSLNFIIGILVGVIILMALNILMIGKGKNWARILYLILFILGAPSFFKGVFSNLSGNLLTLSLELVHFAIQIYALILIFQSSSKPWFHQKKSL